MEIVLNKAWPWLGGPWNASMFWNLDVMQRDVWDTDYIKGESSSWENLS